MILAARSPGGEAVNSQPWGPFRDNPAVVHRASGKAKVVEEGSGPNRVFGPQACQTSKPLINQAKIEFSTVHVGHYCYHQFKKQRKT
jgi:hypothetical protein